MAVTAIPTFIDSYYTGKLYPTLTDEEKLQFINTAFGRLSSFGLSTVADVNSQAREMAFVSYLIYLVEQSVSATEQEELYAIPDSIKRLLAVPQALRFTGTSTRTTTQSTTPTTPGTTPTGPQFTEADATQLIIDLVEDWAFNNTTQVPDNKLGNVSSWALGSNNDEIPPSKIPTPAQDTSDWALLNNQDDIPEDKLGNVEAWTYIDNDEQIPFGKLRNAPALNSRISPYENDIVEFFGTTYSHTHSTAFDLTLADGVSRLGSWRGNNTLFSPTNLNGYIAAGNIVWNESTCSWSNLENPVFGGSVSNQGRFIAVRLRIPGVQITTPSIIMGFRDGGLDYPQLRLNNGRLESNHTGTRTNQQWEVLRGINSVGQITNINFQGGSTAHILVIYQRKENGNVEFICAARQVGGSNPSTYQINNFIETNHSLDVTEVRSRCQTGEWFEAWNDRYISHAQEADLENNRIDEIGLGKIVYTQHDTNNDTYRGDLNVVGKLLVNGTEVSTASTTPMTPTTAPTRVWHTVARYGMGNTTDPTFTLPDEWKGKIREIQYTANLGSVGGSWRLIPGLQMTSFTAFTAANSGQQFLEDGDSAVIRFPNGNNYTMTYANTNTVHSLSFGTNFPFLGGQPNFVSILVEQ